MLFGLLESMVDGLVFVDVEQRVAYWNRRARELLGEDFPFQVGLPRQALEDALAARSLSPAEVRSRLRCSPEDLHAFPQFDLEIAQPHYKMLHVLLFPIHGPQGEDWGCGLALRDVTEQREAEAIKAHLLATVSHELRTPLASIKGFATTLLRSDVAWSQEAQREFLTIINEESDRLTALISELLDTSRLELGEYSIEPEPMALRPVIEQVVFQAQTRTEAHRFVIDCPQEGRPQGAPQPPQSPQQPEGVLLSWADPRRIKQVLHNLLENAIQYSPQGGTIIVRARVRDEEVVISVIDEGIGIPMEEQERIFEPFYRGRALGRGRRKGLGLGLSICRSIVERHGGRIWVESEPGRGSVFSFTLPLASDRGAQDGQSEGAGR